MAIRNLTTDKVITPAGHFRRDIGQRHVLCSSVSGAEKTGKESAIFATGPVNAGGVSIEWAGGGNPSKSGGGGKRTAFKRLWKTASGEPHTAATSAPFKPARGQGAGTLFRGRRLSSQGALEIAGPRPLRRVDGRPRARAAVALKNRVPRADVAPKSAKGYGRALKAFSSRHDEAAAGLVSMIPLPKPRWN